MICRAGAGIEPIDGGGSVPIHPIIALPNQIARGGTADRQRHGRGRDRKGGRGPARSAARQGQVGGGTAGQAGKIINQGIGTVTQSTAGLERGRSAQGKGGAGPGQRNDIRGAPKIIKQGSAGERKIAVDGQRAVGARAGHVEGATAAEIPVNIVNRRTHVTGSQALTCPEGKGGHQTGDIQKSGRSHQDGGAGTNGSGTRQGQGATVDHGVARIGVGGAQGQRAGAIFIQGAATGVRNHLGRNIKHAARSIGKISGAGAQTKLAGAGDPVGGIGRRGEVIAKEFKG